MQSVEDREALLIYLHMLVSRQELHFENLLCFTGSIWDIYGRISCLLISVVLFYNDVKSHRFMYAAIQAFIHAVTHTLTFSMITGHPVLSGGDHAANDMNARYK